MSARALAVGLALAAAPTRSGLSAEPRALLERAIAHAGGRAALERARVLMWDGHGTVTVSARAGMPARVIELAGTWTILPPDTAVVTTFEVDKGPSSTRRLIVASPNGWFQIGGQLLAMPPAALAAERDEFALYAALRLVSLLEPGVELADAPADTAGNAGLRVRRPGRTELTLYIAANGRVAHIGTTVPDALTGQPRRQDMWLAGEISASGIQWPRALHLTIEGQPYVDLEIERLRTPDRFPESLPAPVAPGRPLTRETIRRT